MSQSTANESDEASHDSARLARIQRRFAEFATEYAALPLYSTLSRHLAGDDDLASLLLAARAGQARPVLWLAALHELVLRSPETPAARWYPSVVGTDRLPIGDPWPDVRRTVLEHRDELVERISTHGTQTNEVNRAVYVALGLAAAAYDTRERPLALVELGASAGLLLAVDRYAVRVDSPAGEVVLGDPASTVPCAGLDRSGKVAALGSWVFALPPVRGRVGVDLDPVDLADDDAVRWLEACLWPEVPGRVERFRAARDLLRVQQPSVLRDDMVDGLPAAVAQARSQAGAGAHVVVFSSWALTYVDPSRRTDLEAEVRSLAGGCEALSWLTAEPPACAPGIEPPSGVDAGGTVVGLRRWRDGRERGPVTLGTCHPHGAWVDLSFEGLSRQTSYVDYRRIALSHNGIRVPSKRVRHSRRVATVSERADPARRHTRRALGARPGRGRRGCGGVRWTRAGCRRQRADGGPTGQWGPRRGARAPRPAR